MTVQLTSLIFMFFNVIFITSTSAVNQLIQLMVILMLTCYMTSLYNLWISYMLMFAMISGLLVLFAYVASLSPTYNMSNFMKLILLMNIIFVLTCNKMFYKYFNFKMDMNVPNFLITFLSNDKMSILLYGIFYLLMAMLLLLEVISNCKSSLRTKL
uniref:NADH dehydrogenase subunit 6 n=1 Tax=Macrocheles glaber TaxID=99226 RepID=A0A6B9WGZ3_9ACAR|nr:NADH dehydrogenase subunit 6 [Macrocheles glaber]QHQ98521.1 NADH dehydrogenase subunit 6 [Macrocheles glaber]